VPLPDRGGRIPYRGDELAAQTVDGAIRDDISYTADSGQRRWYLAAAWTFPPVEVVPTVAELVGSGVVGIDLNADHLAVWVVDRRGNPTGAAHTISLDLADLPASQRDGRLRAAISQVVHLARAAGVRAIAIEDLDFGDARTACRETLGRAKKRANDSGGSSTAYPPPASGTGSCT
jgi:hypothetical protein